MLWDDDDVNQEFVVSDEVVDVMFRMQCKALPVEHAWELAQEVCRVLPWIDLEERAGIHQVHGAASGNGWIRPDDSEVLHLSRRTRLMLRLPGHRVEEVSALSGQTLDVLGYLITIGELSVKLFTPASVLFARYVVTPDIIEDEDEFLEWAQDELGKRGVRARKLLCGLSHRLNMPEQVLPTRSLMIADLDRETSVLLQQQGLGSSSLLGCGLFIPHKGIRAVNEGDEQQHFSGT